MSACETRHSSQQARRLAGRSDAASAHRKTEVERRERVLRGPNALAHVAIKHNSRRHRLRRRATQATESWRHAWLGSRARVPSPRSDGSLARARCRRRRKNSQETEFYSLDGWTFIPVGSSHRFGTLFLKRLFHCTSLPKLSLMHTLFGK